MKKPDEITTFRKWWDLNPNYLSGNSFSVHSYCDSFGETLKDWLPELDSNQQPSG